MRWLDNLDNVRSCSATDYVQYECSDCPPCRRKQDQCTQSNCSDVKQTTEKRKKESESAADLNGVETQLQNKIVLLESEDVDHGQCTAGENWEKGHQYEPTTLWRFIKVLTDESQSDSTRVTFQQCETTCSCSKRHVKDRHSQSSAVHEVEVDSTEQRNALAVDAEMSDDRQIQKQSNETLQSLEPSNNAEEMLLLKVIAFLYGQLGSYL